MFIVTGIDSGLGKYLYKNLPGSIGINRKNKDSLNNHSISDAIIFHCAFNSKRDLKNFSLYVEDNYIFTKKLLNIKGIKKIIYFSSIDVYGPITPYSFMKRCAEDLIQNNPLSSSIIRISVPLGPTMRDNSLTKLICNKKISLHKESSFNYILQKDILDSLSFFIKENGIFDFYSNENITLNEVSKKLNLKGEFGDFIYKTNLEDSRVIKNLYPFQKTSLNNIELFINDKK